MSTLHLYTPRIRRWRAARSVWGILIYLGSLRSKRKLGLLKSIKVDKFSMPNEIYPRLFRVAREEIAGHC